MAGFRQYWQNAQNQYNNYGSPKFNLGDRIKSFFTSDSMLPKIILVNIIVWLIALTVDVFSFLFNIASPNAAISNHFIYYLSLPSNIGELLRRPWTLVTYMFVHHNFSHIFYNMLVLYLGGTIFNRYFSNRQFLTTYIIGGLFGAIFFIGGYNFFPAFIEESRYAVAIGASASVMAILLASAMKAPNLEISLFLIGKVKFKWIAIFLLVIDFFSLTGGNAGGHLAHIGGALWGVIYGGLDKANFHVGDMVNRLIQKEKQRKKENHFKQEAKKRAKAEQKAKKEKQDKIDEILKKISKSGYSSLTKEEKDLFFSNSNR